MKCGNPFSFQPGPVSFWTTIVYIALAIPLLYIHESVPPAPVDRVLSRGLNLTEAWQDLQNITNKFHPYNSHENDRVRAFIIRRSEEILKRNGMEYSYSSAALSAEQMRNRTLEVFSDSDLSPSGLRPPGVTLFDDQTSNVTWTYNARQRIGSNIGEDVWQAQYFEGNNFYIYIHGKDDPEGDWWLNESPFRPFRARGGVLVNCHFDSVSTGYGATDDGMACVSMLQMLSHFTSSGRQPRNGIVLLFNNAEEEGLHGARAFGYSPLLQFLHTFVNLEGAGAGGRAILFRTTDLQAAKAYGRSPHPFGSVVAANAFERGVIKSATDFEIWKEYGQRGMDIAFYEPRSRYHTEDDDVRHTSIDSIWHMLSAALASTQQLSETTGTVFNGPRSDGKTDRVQSGKPTEGVWFDMFGKAWAAFALRGLFAWSLTLLVATPLILLFITFLLVRNDKYYFFAKDIKMHEDLDNDPVVLGGWKGFFRFPLAMIFACGLTIASAFILAKFNPFVIYSCGYSVWAMTFSLFYFTFWLIVRGASFVRPSALHRGFVNIWLYALGWGLQVAAAVFEDRMHIAALYGTVFLQSAVFLSLVISLLEQLALLGKHDFAQQLHDAHQARDRPSRVPPTGTDGGQDEDDGDGAGNGSESPTETTPLRAGETGYGSNQQTSFANTYRRSVTETAHSPPSIGSYQPYSHEQTWSGRLPSWTWLFQFLILAPVPVILFGNLGLIALSALRMTGADGGSVLVPLLTLALVSIMLLVPITPFMHRVTHHVPMFLLCVFTATFIYNLVVFPFSTTHRFKFNFQQVIDLEKNTNIVKLTGMEKYTLDVIRSVPVAAGQEIICEKSLVRPELADCTYDASELPPNLVLGKEFSELMSVTKLEDTSDGLVRLQIDALDTRLCSLNTSQPVYDMQVKGGNPRDPRFGDAPTAGVTHIQIWRRDRDVPWEVTLHLQDQKRLEQDGNEAETTGLAKRAEALEILLMCGWADANDESTIPAFRQLTQYMPSWAVVTKKNSALVEVHQMFKIQL